MDPSNLSDRELLLLIHTNLGNLSAKVEDLKKDQIKLRSEFHDAEIKSAQATVSKQAFETLQTEVSRLSLKIATTEIEARTKLAVLGSGVGIAASILTTVIMRLITQK